MLQPQPWKIEVKTWNHATSMFTQTMQKKQYLDIHTIKVELPCFQGSVSKGRSNETGRAEDKAAGKAHKLAAAGGNKLR